VIELTDQLQQALDNIQGEPVRLLDPRTRQTYVLVRTEVYERLRTIISQDDGLKQRLNDCLKAALEIV
jgi:hypothetical protein